MKRTKCKVLLHTQLYPTALLLKQIKKSYYTSLSILYPTLLNYYPYNFSTLHLHLSLRHEPSAI